MTLFFFSLSSKNSFSTYFPLISCQERGTTGGLQPFLLSVCPEAVLPVTTKKHLSRPSGCSSNLVFLCPPHCRFTGGSCVAQNPRKWQGWLVFPLPLLKTLSWTLLLLTARGLGQSQNSGACWPGSTPRFDESLGSTIPSTITQWTHPGSFSTHTVQFFSWKVANHKAQSKCWQRPRVHQ